MLSTKTLVVKLNTVHPQVVGAVVAAILAAAEGAHPAARGDGRQIMEPFQKLNREGTTIIQVTHSEFNAGFGNRVLHIFDGRIEEPEKTGQIRTTEEEQTE